MTSFGCAYWGHQPSEMHALAEQGFAWVVLPVSEDRALHDAGGVAELVAEAQIAGLRTLIAPWGVGNRFAGPALGTDDLDHTLAWWDAVNLAEPDAILWNEPNDGGMVIVGLLMDRTTRPCELRWNPDRCDLRDAVFARMDRLHLTFRGDTGPTGTMSTVLQRDALRFPRGQDVAAWVDATGMTGAQSRDPADRIMRLIDAGIQTIGVWGYPSANPSCLRNANKHAVWQAVLSAMRVRR